MKRIFIGLASLTLLSGILFAANEYKQPNNAIFYGTLRNTPLNTAGIVTNTSGGQLGTVNPVPLANGGTASTTLSAAAGGVVYGSGTALVSQAAGTSGQVLTSGGAGAPTWTSTLGISQGGTNNASLGPVVGGVVYTDATKLNTLAAGTSGQVLTSTGAGTPTWATASTTVPTSPQDASNYSITTSVAANALTIALKTASGSDCSGGSPCEFTFRNATQTTGTVARVSVTSALSLVIPASTTIGSISNAVERYCVYLQNNAGTVILAVSLNCSLNLSSVRTSESISGGTDRTALYATTGVASLPTSIIGHFTATEATAGTWATAPSIVTSYNEVPFINSVIHSISGGARIVSARIANNGTCTVTDGHGGSVASCTRTALGLCTVTFGTGFCSATPSCMVTAAVNSNKNCVHTATISSASVQTDCETISTDTQSDENHDVVCICAH